MALEAHPAHGGIDTVYEAQSPAQRNGRRELTTVDLMLAVAEHAKLVIVLPLLLAAAFVVAALLRPSYVTESSFSPQSSSIGMSRAMSALGGLAAALPLGLGSSSESVDFYAALLKSPGTLGNLAQTEFTVSRGSGVPPVHATVMQLYGIGGSSENDRLVKAIDLLEKLVVVRADAEANLVTIDTRSKWPDLSVQMNRHLVDFVNDFNTTRRQTRARQEREFIARRLAQSNQEVRAAEDAMRAFLQQNRSFENSPGLMFEHQRLQQQLSLLQDVNQTLAQSYEQARIDEVRNTSVITVVDNPGGVVRRATPLSVAAMTGVITGLALALVIVIAGEAVRRDRFRNPEKYEPFHEFGARIWRSVGRASAR